MITTIWQDLRHGAHVTKNPASLSLILALALGIGANTAIFSVINAVLLRPLPFEEADRLVFLNETSKVMDDLRLVSQLLRLAEPEQGLREDRVYNRGSYNLTGAGEAERIIAAQMSADVFAALR